jgi:hypothetical protein
MVKSEPPRGLDETESKPAFIVALLGHIQPKRGVAEKGAGTTTEASVRGIDAKGDGPRNANPPTKN